MREINLIYFIIVVLIFLNFGCGDSTSNVEESKIKYVPDDFTTIQEAIDSSETGDTIVVKPGIYKENINFHSKGIVLASRFLEDKNNAYIAQTVIDGSDTTNVSVITMSKCVDTVPLALVGFTVTGGRTSLGGGISVSMCDPLISNCAIDSNSAYGST